METKFIELANTELSDKEFFEEIFSDYINYLYNDKRDCVKDLANIRFLFNHNNPHTKEHLRDNIESVLYNYNKIEHYTANADKLEMKYRIAQLEERIERMERIMEEIYLYQEKL
jgi:hypothetical protein